MEKAYDFKNLVERYKKLGIDNAEEVAVDVFQETMKWGKESAAKSPNPYDDIFFASVTAMEKKVLGEIDKIDGEDDEGR